MLAAQGCPCAPAPGCDCHVSCQLPAHQFKVSFLGTASSASNASECAIECSCPQLAVAAQFDLGQSASLQWRGVTSGARHEQPMCFYSRNALAVTCDMTKLFTRSDCKFALVHRAFRRSPFQLQHQTAVSTSGTSPSPTDT
jgi:hypothetical protein